MATGTTCMETAQAEMKPAPIPVAAPAPLAAPAPRFTAWLCLAAALVCGGLLFLCFQPVGWGTYLGWIALVPFLTLVRSQAKPWFTYLSALLCGLVFFVPVLHWMSVADKAMVAAWLALSAYCAFYFVAALFLVRRLEALRLPLVLSVPLVWAALEYFRSFFLTGFAWYYLAHTQHDLLPMIQITDLGGVYLVTFMVAAVNALLFDIAYQFPEIRAWFGQKELDPARTYSSLELLNRSFMGEWLFRRNLILEGMALTALLIGVYAYGETRLAQDRFGAGPVVCLLQSNLDQRLRESNDDRSAETATKHFTALCLRASFNHETKPDLLIWPETSYPIPWYGIRRDFPTEKLGHPKAAEYAKWEIKMAERFKELTADTTKVPHLIGINTNRLAPPTPSQPDGPNLHYNSAMLVDARGKIQGTYDKIHRVPFGEYVPLKDWQPFLNWLTPYEGDFGIQAGNTLTRFQSGKHQFGVLLCYEDTDPALARRYLDDGKDGPPVDFLVNMSNDGWFDGSVEHEEHLAVSRFRAIECRRAMIRAVNMGVSAVIDGNGRVLKPREIPNTNPPVWMVVPEKLSIPELPVSQWSQFKQKAGILKAVVPIDSRQSFYARSGDWLPIGCWAIVLGGTSWTWLRRKKEFNHK